MKTYGKILISVIIGLIFLELCIRIIYFFRPNLKAKIYQGGAHPRHLVIPHPVMGYTLNPAFKGVETNDYREYRISVKINSQGLRDNEHNLSQDTFRIVGLGDSFTFGEGVELQDSYLSLLETELNKRYPGKIEIFKAGVPGYSIKQEVEFLKEKISTFKPHLVIMGLLPLEFFRIDTPYTYCHGYIVSKEKLNQLYLVAGKLYSCKNKNKTLARINAWLKHYYLTPEFFKSRYKWIKHYLKKEIAPSIPTSLDIEILTQRYAKTFSVLKEFASICHKHNALPMVVLINGDMQTDSFIADFASNQNIFCLSLYPYFKRAHEKNIAYHFPYDKHWNRTGHRIAACAILEFLTKEGLINPHFTILKD